MAEKIKVAPVPGRLVRVPESGRVIDRPMEVTFDAFIRRRLKDGDLKKADEVKKNGD